jgi:competence protein ComEC
LLALSPDAIAEDCARADLILTPLVSRDLCKSAAIIDRFDLADEGAHAIWLSPGGIRIATVAGFMGRRAWNAAGAPGDDDDGS